MSDKPKSRKSQASKLRLRGFARRLRRNMTGAERALWRLIRKRQLAGYRFLRQKPIAGFICDFVCVARKVIIEVDGGYHDDPLVKDRDARRDIALSDSGYTVLRFRNEECLQRPSMVLQAIYQTLT